MMKLPIIAGTIVLAFAAEGVMAACATPSVQVQDAALTSTLTNNTVCASRGGESWQEAHHSDGSLVDYKMGPSDAVDPTKQVGTWLITGAGASSAVTYTYGSGAYSYQVWDNQNGTYSFCGVDTIDFTISSGTGVSCPGAGGFGREIVAQ